MVCECTTVAFDILLWYQGIHNDENTSCNIIYLWCIVKDQMVSKPEKILVTFLSLSQTNMPKENIFYQNFNVLKNNEMMLLFEKYCDKLTLMIDND